MKSTISFLVFLLVLSISACGGSTASNLQVKDAWVRAAKTMEMQMNSETSMSSSAHMDSSNSAAYMILQNPSKDLDRLVGVKCDVAETAELHMSQTENGVTSMKQVEAIDIPAGGETELKPGGLHIMLIGLKQDLKAGDLVQLTLDFEKSGTVMVEAEVRAP